MNLIHVKPDLGAHQPRLLTGVLLEQAGLLLVGGQNGTDGTGDICSPELGDQTGRRSATSAPCSPRPAPTNATSRSSRSIFRPART